MCVFLFYRVLSSASTACVCHNDAEIQEEADTEELDTELKEESRTSSIILIIHVCERRGIGSKCRFKRSLERRSKSSSQVSVLSSTNLSTLQPLLTPMPLLQPIRHFCESLRHDHPEYISSGTSLLITLMACYLVLFRGNHHCNTLVKLGGGILAW